MYIQSPSGQRFGKGGNRLRFPTETERMMEICQQNEDRTLLPEPGCPLLEDPRMARFRGTQRTWRTTSLQQHEGWEPPSQSPCPFPLKTPHINFPLPGIQAAQTWLDGGRNAKTRNPFQSTIFLHFSNYKVSMTYK